MRYRDLRVGQAFRFTGLDGVWVRCRGGFRPGCGGKLRQCNTRLGVELWSGVNE